MYQKWMKVVIHITVIKVCGMKSIKVVNHNGNKSGDGVIDMNEIHENTM